MKLYKMRSLKNEGLEFVLDIILNERLYCASFTDLNDPLEGVYLTASVPFFLPRFPKGNGTVRVSKVDASQSYEHEKFNKVCSLNKVFNDLRMWSHYGDGHRGVAIEIDFSDHEADVHPVRYLPELKRYIDTVIGTPFADEVLSQKTMHWVYEEEFRILQPDKYYDVKNRISAIYLGSRVSEDRKALLNKLVPHTIPIYFTKINESTLEVEPSGLMQRAKL